jgi:hypothetical protein
MDLFFIPCRATSVLAFGMMKGPNLALSEDRRVAVERGARGAGDFDGENLAYVAGRPFEDDDLVRAGAPGDINRGPLLPLQECPLLSDF